MNMTTTNPTYDFSGQVALVTGAAMGMGLATARAFAQSHASVILADLDGDRAAEEAAQIVKEGGIALSVACDVTDETQVVTMVDRATAERYPTARQPSNELLGVAHDVFFTGVGSIEFEHRELRIVLRTDLVATERPRDLKDSRVTDREKALHLVLGRRRQVQKAFPRYRERVKMEIAAR